MKIQTNISAIEVRFKKKLGKDRKVEAVQSYVGME